MSVYDIYGNEKNIVYDIYGNALSMAYDIEEKELLNNIRDDRLLVWSDEFIGNSINPQKWEHLFGYYTSYRYYMYKNNLQNNAFCDNGLLHYNNKKDSQMPLTPWSGCFLWTNGIFEFRYGLIEARIKFPDNDSYHSTLWTMGSGYKRICYEDSIANSSMGLKWSECGEIDIAEADSGIVTSSEIWKDIEGNTRYSNAIRLTDNASKWHIYGIEWTEQYINIYCDRVLMGTFDINDANVNNYNAFRRSHFLILNQLPTSIHNEQQTQNEIETLVDWVRVYAPVGTTEIILDNSIALDVNNLTLGVGDNHFIDVIFNPTNTTNMAIAWYSSNENVAVVYGGKVTAIAQGETTITAISKNGNVARCNVTVVS